MNSPAPQCRSPVRGDVTSARCPCTFQLTFCYDTERSLHRVPEERKRERERERERLRRLATKITRKRESNKEGRGIITAISLNRHSSRLIVYKPSFYLHTEFFQHSRFDSVWYYSLLADCVGLNFISGSMDARLIQLIRFFGEYFCPGREEHQSNAMTYVNK